MRLALFAGLALLLLAAMGIIAYAGSRQAAQVRQFRGRVSDLLPRQLPGWNRLERPIADTPEMKAAVNELLNFNDAVYIEYTQGPARVSVYLAYWEPGRMSARLIAGHTPDVCWVGNGWVDESARITEATPPPEAYREAERRVFSLNGTREYVWYWHIVGTTVRSPRLQAQNPMTGIWDDLMGRGLNQREEQFFVRISSDRPLSEPPCSAILPSLLHAVPLPRPAGEPSF
jgi:hypothetical protein